MYGAAVRTSLRSPAPRYLLRHNLSRRLISSTPPAQRPRSWKSSLARWGLGIGGLWYFSTSAAFAEEPAYAAFHQQDGEDTLTTTQSVDELAEARRRRRALAAAAPVSTSLDAPSPSTTPQLSTAASSAVLQEATTSGTSSGIDTTPPSSSSPASPATGADAGSPQDLEEEASEQGAFNEETGEINWDCPCLGGMAHGPCGPEFKEAFSCFVYSKEEPKGVDCIDRFKGMQECFRKYPDVYGAELGEEGDEEEEPVPSDGEPQTSPVAPSPGAAMAREKPADANMNDALASSPASTAAAADSLPSKGGQTAKPST